MTVACDELLVRTEATICSLVKLSEVLLLDSSLEAMLEDDGVGVVVTAGVVDVVTVGSVGVNGGAGGKADVDAANGMDERERLADGGRLPEGGAREGFDVWEVVVFDLV